MEEILQLVSTDPEKCVQKLQQYLVGRENDLDALQLAAEIHFELGNGELAYEALSRALELDPQGKLGGTNKFLWLGQLSGGTDGLKFYDQGIANTTDTAQLQQAYLGMIEIWMTDLCMEPEAESQCESLIAKALLLDESNPEVWSILGSIRISQQKPDEAKEALLKSWSLYEGNATVVALPGLVRLAQSMLECELYDEVLDLTVLGTKLDDEVPDLYYLNALAHKMGYEATKQDRHAAGARDAIELLVALPQVDPEMLQAAQDVATELPEVDLPASEDEEDPESLE